MANMASAVKKQLELQAENILSAYHDVYDVEINVTKKKK